MINRNLELKEITEYQPPLAARESSKSEKDLLLFCRPIPFPAILFLTSYS